MRGRMRLTWRMAILAMALTGLFQSQVLAQSEDQELSAQEELNQILYAEKSRLDSAEDNVSDDIASRYTLGPDDQIEISVMRHPEVSGIYNITKEGQIQYEFVGDIEVSGMTKSGVADLIVKRLSEYIINPEVTVKITQYNSKIVYVIGEVGAPGKIIMRGDTITVREALMQAGLPLLSAKTAKSVLITPSESGDSDQKRVNVHKLLYEGDLRENLVMKPGDTLYVPPTIMAKAMRVIQPVAAPIGTAAGTGRTVTTGF